METPEGWNVDFSDVRFHHFCCGNIRHIPLESINDKWKIGLLKEWQETNTYSNPNTWSLSQQTANHGHSSQTRSLMPAWPWCDVQRSLRDSTDMSTLVYVAEPLKDWLLSWKMISKPKRCQVSSVLCIVVQDMSFCSSPVCLVTSVFAKRVRIRKGCCLVEDWLDN